MSTVLHPHTIQNFNKMNASAEKEVHGTEAHPATMNIS